MVAHQRREPPIPTAPICVLACGGMISAEHGIGIAKARWLLDARDAEDVRAMRSLNAALDPLDLLNPGVVLRSETEVGSP